MCLCRLELTKVDSVTQWLIDLRSLTDSECGCVLQGKSLTADSSEIVFSPPKLISGQFHWLIGFGTLCTVNYAWWNLKNKADSWLLFFGRFSQQSQVLSLIFIVFHFISQIVRLAHGVDSDHCFWYPGHNICAHLTACQLLLCAVRQIRSIRRSLPRSALSALATLFILSRVDYCNVVLAGLPQCELQRLQTVLSAAARLTADVHKYDHVTPLLEGLHWLPVPERIIYKLCTLTFRCLNGSALHYLSELLQPVTDLESRQRLWSSSSQLAVPCMWCSTITDHAFTVADCHHWNNWRNFWNLIYLKLHLHIRTVSNCKALSKQLVLPSALYKLSVYITLHLHHKK